MRIAPKYLDMYIAPRSFMFTQRVAATTLCLGTSGWCEDIGHMNFCHQLKRQEGRSFLNCYEYMYYEFLDLIIVNDDDDDDIMSDNHKWRST